jgi:hypothetical protein
LDCFVAALTVCFSWRRKHTVALRAGTALDVGAEVAEEEIAPSVEEGLLKYKLRSSVPRNGFQHIDVLRLVLMFGRQENVVPIAARNSSLFRIKSLFYKKPFMLRRQEAPISGESIFGLA